MTKEMELAKEIIEGIKQIGMPSIIDKKEYFDSGEYNLKIFETECKQLGYKVIPIERTEYAAMPLKNKLIILKY